MAENVKIVVESDCDKEEIKSLFDRMKENNLPLYTSVYKRMRSHGGIRLDVLEELSAHARDYSDDEQVLIGFSPMIDHDNLSSDWYLWFNDYISGDGKLSISDLMFLVDQAALKNIPFEKFKGFFEGNPETEMDVYQKLSMSDNSDDDPASMNKTEHKDVAKAHNELIRSENRVNPIKTNDTGTVSDQTANAVAVFNNLLNVITTGRPDQRSIVTIENQFNVFINDLQEYVRRLSVFMNDIIREWEDDKVENERLRALYQIEEQLLSSQTRRIKELEEEKAALNEKIKGAEMSEMRCKAINRKISELQSLTGKESELMAINFPNEV